LSWKPAKKKPAGHSVPARNGLSTPFPPNDGVLDRSSPLPASDAPVSFVFRSFRIRPGRLAAYEMPGRSARERFSQCKTRRLPLWSTPLTRLRAAG
jgi:hypothetical protein